MLNTNNNNKNNNTNNKAMGLDINGRIPLRNLPEATHQGTLTLDGVLVEVAILETKMRVISVKGLYKLFEFKYKGNETINGLPYFLSADYLQPYLTEELKDLATNKIKYKDSRANRKECFDVAIIPFITELFIQAENSKHIKQRIVDKSYRISTLLFLKGATELVNEALLYFKADSDLPYVIENTPNNLATGVDEAYIPYGKISINVAVVNGVPAIKTTDIFTILGMEYKGNLVHGLPIYASVSYILKHLSPEAIDILKNPIIYRNRRNKIQKAYNIYIVDLLFRAYCKSFLAGDMKKKSVMLRFKELRNLFTHVSIVGLVSMVDKAVGYKRTKKETNANILNRLVGTKGERLDVIQYNESFYHDVFKVLNIDYNLYRYVSLPVVGKFINQYIYDTIEVDLSIRLKEIRAQDKDNANKMMYNYFTKDIGIYVLQLHIASVEHRLRSVRTLEEFKQSVKDKPLQLTPEKVELYVKRIEYFDYVYDNVLDKTFAKYNYKTGFILWSCNVFHIGDIEQTLFCSPAVDEPFVFNYYRPDGLYIHKDVCDFFKLVKAEKLEDARSKIKYIDTLFKQPELSTCTLLSQAMFKTVVKDTFKIVL